MSFPLYQLTLPSRTYPTHSFITSPGSFFIQAESVSPQGFLSILRSRLPLKRACDSPFSLLSSGLKLLFDALPWLRYLLCLPPSTERSGNLFYLQLYTGRSTSLSLTDSEDRLRFCFESKKAYWASCYCNLKVHNCLSRLNKKEVLCFHLRLGALLSTRDQA